MEKSEDTLPQLTLRALLTGMIIGAILTPANIYSGLRIGWSFNMSINACLLSYAIWKLFEVFGAAPWGEKENTINQTTASSAASIISGGLVAPIPALTLITGQQMSWAVMSAWVFAVSATGITVAVALRRQMLIREKLAFPAGVATAETIREIYAKGKEAFQRVAVLLSAGVSAMALELMKRLGPGVWTPTFTQVAAKGGAMGGTTASWSNLSFGLDPSLLMIGFGAIIGIRAGISLLIGAIVGWGVLMPYALQQGWAPVGVADPSANWFGGLVEWLLWPGVTMMVVSSLTSFAFSLWEAYGKKKPATDSDEPGVLVDDAGQRIEEDAPGVAEGIPASWFWGGLLVFGGAAVVAQVTIFNIHWLPALLAIPISFVLGVVAARVVGETGIPPIGALGKVSQVAFAAIAPANVTANLMTANVAGGTAGQCSDLLNDLKTGLLVRVNPRSQIIAQVFGILVGSLVGCGTYLLLIPDPQTMLITDEWPAPAVATWKAVAEVLQDGLSTIPMHARWAMLIAAVLALAIEVVSRLSPQKVRKWLPSIPAVGLAFVIPASLSISMFLGALLAWLASKWVPNLAARFTLSIAAGFVAGESLAGVGAVLWQYLVSS